MPVNLDIIPMLQGPGRMRDERFVSNPRLALRAEKDQQIGYLPMIQDRVEGSDTGTLNDDIIVGVASNVGNTRGRIERIKLDLTIGSNYL
jgi:hypothetical protein